MNPENEISDKVALRASQLGFITFRNNVGVGVVGKIDRDHRKRVYVVHHGRMIRFGLHTGSSDRIGWRSIEITPDMVGKKLAVFAAVEVKTATGRLSQDQRNFLAQVAEAGGIAIVARGPADIPEIPEPGKLEL